MTCVLHTARWLSLVVGPLLLTAACDPNVIIGGKLRLADGGSPPSSSAGTDSGAAPGGGTGGDAVGGIASGGSGAAAAAGGGGSDGAGGEAGGSGAAGEAGASGGEPGVIHFEADHEDGTGSLDQWDEGPDEDAGGYYGDAQSGSPVFSTAQYRSGTGSAKATINTAGGTDQISRLYRRISTDEAYYSAWFYLAEDHVPGRWWSIFLFRAVQDRTKSIDLWSVNLVRSEADELTLSVFRHADNRVVAVTGDPVVPVGKWFQLEAYLFARAGQPSQLKLWFDGQQVLALPDTTAAPQGQPLYWVIGNGAAPFTPAISTVYVDDALVSSTRRGP